MFFKRKYPRFCCVIHLTAIGRHLSDQFLLFIHVANSFVILIISYHLFSVVKYIAIVQQLIESSRTASFGRVWLLDLVETSRHVLIYVGIMYHVWQKLVTHSCTEGLGHFVAFFIDGLVMILFVDAALHPFALLLLQTLFKSESLIFIWQLKVHIIELRKFQWALTSFHFLSHTPLTIGICYKRLDFSMSPVEILLLLS